MRRSCSSRKPAHAFTQRGESLPSRCCEVPLLRSGALQKSHAHCPCNPFLPAGGCAKGQQVCLQAIYLLLASARGAALLAPKEACEAAKKERQAAEAAG